MFVYRCVNNHCRHYGKVLDGEPDSAYCKCGDAFEVFQAPEADEVDQLRASNAELLRALKIIVNADRDGFITHRDWDIARAAIAKAEGRSC